MSNPLQQLATLREAIIHGYRTTKYVNYLGVSGHALVVADFLHTFPAEVRLMWPTPLSLPKVLFFSLRYYIMVHHIFAILYALPPNLSPEVCMNGLVRIGVSSTAVIVASEAILFVRVYAFSGRKKKMLVYLIVQFIVLHVPGFVLLAKFLQSVRFVKLPMNNLLCMPVRMSSPLLGGLFGCLLGSVVIVMLIMMFIAYRKHQNFNSALLTVFYRDGIFYFICLSALAVGNIIVTFAANDGGLKFLLIQAEVDAHCILSTRMLLHLRASAEKEPIMKGGKLRYTGTIGDAMNFSTTCGPDTSRQVTITTTTCTTVDSDITVSTYAGA